MRRKIRKKCMLALMMVLAIGQTSTFASAHGHHGGGHHSRRSTTYSQCTVKNCTSTKKHKHHGTTYLPCSPCTVDGCTSTKKHKHHGVSYLPCDTHHE